MRGRSCSCAFTGHRPGKLPWREDENDLRCNRIALTEKGIQRTEYIHSQFDKLDKRMFKGFTKEELSLLNSFLNRLIDNISEDAPSEKAIFEMMMRSHEKGGDDNA